MSARLLRIDTPAADAPPPARRLGKFTITRELGEGAMGVVYEGIDRLLNRRVAIKTIRRHTDAPTATRLSADLRFRNEAQAAGRLNHVGIVSVYEYGEDGDDAFIAMEYVEGWPLSRWTLRGMRLPIDDVLSLMVQLFDALHHAHEQGVWHRDIKPGNIIVTASGRAKITDFGIACVDSAPVTQGCMVMGSPGYMAPERYTGDHIDRRVDVYSCGVLLYELLTGVRPFVGGPDVVMHQTLHSAPPPPSRATTIRTPPACFDAIVAQAIARRPDDRFDSVREFRDALVQAAARPIRRVISADAIKLVMTDTAVAAPVSEQTTIPPASGIEAATLAKIESMLMQYAGPVARVLVRRAAVDCRSVMALIARLADDTLEGTDRRSFVELATKAAGGAPRSSTGAPVQAAARTSERGLRTLERPTVEATPLRAETVHKAQRVLAFHIGPIAKLMVKSAASIAPTREQFFIVLADLAADGVDRERLLRDLADSI